MKDAKGHGSNARAIATAAGYSVVQKPSLGHFIQGPSGEHGPYFAARGAWSDAARLATTFGGKGQDAAAAKELASGLKSAEVPVHEAMNSSTHNSQGHAWGSPEALKDFSARHNPKGFASGKREINRLRRQGK